jgi:hypothetical protein
MNKPKPCPLCGGEPIRQDDAVGCDECGVSADSATWDALPRIRPDAEALVDAFGKACIRRSFEGRVDATNSRAELLRACVVDAAEPGWKAYVAKLEDEVAALRVQRDEAVAEVKRLGEPDLPTDFPARTTGVPEAVPCKEPCSVCKFAGSAGDAPCSGTQGHAPMTSPFHHICAECEADREKDTPTPPPADDADALLDALVESAVLLDDDDFDSLPRYKSARSAVRARMRPWPTVEQLMAEMLEKHRWCAPSVEEPLRAALAALGGGK